MKQKGKTFLAWTILVLLFVLLFQLSQSKQPTSHEGFETFLQHVEKGRVASVRANNNEVLVTLNDSDERYVTLGVMNDELIKVLSEHGILVYWGEEPHLIRTLLVYGVPLGLLLAFLGYFIKKVGGGTTNILSLGKSKVRLLSASSGVTFADVGGCVEAEELFGDVIDSLKNPTRWKDAGARLPGGVLLEGPPGCGKTLLARAVAGEAEARFYFVSVSEFVEMFVGVGASRVRDMFETAAKTPPAIIFIDELDAVDQTFWIKRCCGPAASIEA